MVKHLGLFPLLALVLFGACTSQRELVISQAASLSRFFFDLESGLAQTLPRTQRRFEVGGSQALARKISELHGRSDLLAVADPEVLDDILVPGFVEWYVVFAATEIVLAHMEHSRFATEISADNWTQVLLRDGVRLGCVDVDQAPIGYRTALVWQLASLHMPQPSSSPTNDNPTARTHSFDLADQLAARCAKEHTMPHENELMALLESRAIDYAFTYRSTAEDQRLQLTRLPATINLGDVSMADTYRRAQVQVRMGSSQEKTTLRGRPVVYALTIPKNAANPADAALALRYILSAEGQKAMQRRGFLPITPPRIAIRGAIPDFLKELDMEPWE